LLPREKEDPGRAGCLSSQDQGPLTTGGCQIFVIVEDGEELEVGEIALGILDDKGQEREGDDGTGQAEQGQAGGEEPPLLESPGQLEEQEEADAGAGERPPAPVLIRDRKHPAVTLVPAILTPLMTSDRHPR